VSQLSLLKHQTLLKESTFIVNERNSNNNSLKGKVEEMNKNINVFQIVGMDQMEQWSIVLSLRLKDFSKKTNIQY
jgi:hypothetical protein